MVKNKIANNNQILESQRKSSVGLELGLIEG
jgi:hypothetical protein